MNLPTSATWLLAINVAATWYMVGLIWMVQVVHYKMFDRVGDDEFARYAIDHARLITPIVALPMLVELASAAALCWITPPGMSRALLIVGFGLVILIWLSTALLQVPAHERLAKGFDVVVYQRLVSTNWIRTVAWTIRGVMLFFLIVSWLNQLIRN